MGIMELILFSSSKTTLMKMEVHIVGTFKQTKH